LAFVWGMFWGLTTVALLHALGAYPDGAAIMSIAASEALPCGLGAAFVSSSYGSRPVVLILIGALFAAYPGAAVELRYVARCPYFFPDPVGLFLRVASAGCILRQLPLRHGRLIVGIFVYIAIGVCQKINITVKADNGYFVDPLLYGIFVPVILAIAAVPPLANPPFDTFAGRAPTKG
jgi:hypothetical protein